VERQNGGVSTTEADRARIAARYPERPAIHRLLRLAIATLAVLGLGWTVWAGLHHANPPVDADVFGFTVPSDQQVDVELRIQRTDPGTAVVCTVVAQAPSGAGVGRLEARIEPGTHKVERHVVNVKTVNRATTAIVQDCRTA